MVPRIKLTAIALACSLAWPPATVAQPQAALGDWSRVRQLPPSTSIVVKTKARASYHGELIDVTESSLSMQSDERAFPGRANRKRELRREDVMEIRRLSRAGSTLAGTAIGVAAGTGIGLAVDLSARSNEDRGLATALFAVLGGLLGWAVGRHSTLVKGAKIYVAP